MSEREQEISDLRAEIAAKDKEIERLRKERDVQFSTWTEFLRENGVIIEAVGNKGGTSYFTLKIEAEARCRELTEALRKAIPRIGHPQECSQKCCCGIADMRALIADPKTP